MPFDQSTRLVETSAVVWFLGFGVGGATGLALVSALCAIWIASPLWVVIAATLIAAMHASIMGAFWLRRETVRRRTAILVSMIASAILTSALAWMVGAYGGQSSPLYGLAFMHLIMAFCHPANFTTSKSTD
jgi:predicted PurR-regulated permease PerM